MRLLTIFILFLSCFLSLLEADYIIPETTVLGWGYNSYITGPASIGINPAGVSDTKYDYFSITLIKPFVFHNFNLLFKLQNSFGINISISQTGEFYSYNAGIGGRITDYLNAGVNFGILRESPVFRDKIDYAFSPGIQFKVKRYSTSSPIGIKAGLYFRNILTGDNLIFYKDYTKPSFEYGIMFKAMIQDLTFYIGGKYFEEKQDFSAGAEYKLTELISLWTGVKTDKQLTGGIKLGDIGENIAAGISYDLDIKEEFYSLSYTRSIGKLKTIIKRKRRRRITRRTLERQKELINEGLIYYREKDYEKAKRLWQKAYKLAPRSKYGKEAKKYLQRVRRILREIEE